MRLLAIETSCDESSVAVVEDGRRVLSNVIASQVVLHAETGGVVPEVAAREHIKNILPVLMEALNLAGTQPEDLDAIAVTKEPGLVGSLVVGRMTAAALAFAWNKPLIEVHHVHGHLYAPWLETNPEPKFPIVSLTLSGGHNELVLLRGHGNMEVLAETLDDAAGEAFDKVARLLGLGYPGGPAIEARARLGNPRAVDFPVAMKHEQHFSFSGLKTSVLYYLQKHPERLSEPGFVNDVAASFQSSVIRALVGKLMEAVRTHNPKEVHLTGGVSANRALREAIEKALKSLPGQNGPVFRCPVKMDYCTDNAAMIGAAGFYMDKKDVSA